MEILHRDSKSAVLRSLVQRILYSQVLHALVQGLHSEIVHRDSKSGTYRYTSYSCSGVRPGDVALRLEIGHLARFVVLLFGGYVR